QLHADGPGELRMVQDRGSERQVITARWQKELQIQRQEQNHVISLLEAATVTIDPMGRFDGNELYLWVTEVAVPPAPATTQDGAQPAVPEEQKPKMTLVADRMLAIGNVRVVSQQLDVDTPRLEAWFINLPAEPAQMQPLAP